MMEHGWQPCLFLLNIPKVSERIAAKEQVT